MQKAETKPEHQKMKNNQTEIQTTELICPVCGHPLSEKKDGKRKSFFCDSGHQFDAARSGYVNLSMKQKTSGDNKEMVLARTRFLEEGYYSFLKEAILEKLGKAHPGLLIDLGCGEGWYTRDFSLKSGSCYGIDLSKEAVDHAAKTDKKTQYIVGTIYRLPFEDSSADVITSVFTPIPEAEIYRVLKPGGLFISASPGKMHHYELKEVLYDRVRLNDEPETLHRLNLLEREEIERKMHVENPQALLDMTPYRYRAPKEGLQRMENLKDGLDVQFDFLVSTWQKPEHSADKTENKSEGKA